MNKGILELTKLPFRQLQRQIIYVENEYNEDVNQYIRKNYYVIKSYFQRYKKEFIYFPKLSEEIQSESVIGYNAPSEKPRVNKIKIGSDFILQFMVHPENRKHITPALLYYYPQATDKSLKEAKCQYRICFLTKDDAYKQTDNLSNILDEIIAEKIRYKKNNGPDIHSVRIPRLKPIEPEKPYDSYDKEVKRMIRKVTEEVEELKLRGVSQYILEQIIHGEQKLSRLHITKDFRIFLPDYRDMEIEMKPLPKAVFLLFLRHPEGIEFKYLPDYRDELLDIYLKIKGGSDFISDATRNSIEKVTDPLDNSINEKCSRIKEAFILKFDDHLAKNYYINGYWGEPKKILLPRNLVIWDV
jgi:hypothetical protein